MTRARDQLDEGGVVSMGVGRPVRLGTRHGVLPGQVKTNRVGSVFLCAANASLVLLVVTYLALRPSGSGEQQGRHSVLLQAVGSDRSGVQPNRPQGRDGEAAPGGGSSTAVAGVHRASVAAMAAAGAKAGAVMWADMQRVAASKARQQQQQQQRRPRAHAPAGERQLHLQALACGTCAYKDNPLSEIDEPNVFPGPSEFGPDSPSPLGPLGNALDSACCAGTGGNAFGAPELSVADMRKVYELGEPNFKTWKEYEKAHNVFPGIVDWDPDSPRGYNAPFETKELFDGHGGIIGLEDSDDWAVTPDSAASSEYDTYADGASVGRDQNVFANGYQFPEY